MKNDIYHHIHFIGIGGIGMSGIAKIMRLQGHTVSGCDTNIQQRTVYELQQIGCQITHGHNQTACHDPSITMVVHSTAIRPDNPELAAAREHNIAIKHRSHLLSFLVDKHPASIGITGAHGKTTTTAMIGHILRETNHTPTIVAGGHIHAFNSNAVYDKGNVIVAEIDESDRSLLNIQPQITVITNIDLEHLETYRDWDDITATFQTYLTALAARHGTAILCADDDYLRQLAHPDYIFYGLHPDSHIHGSNLERTPTHSTLTVTDTRCDQVLGTLMVPAPGIHNVLNALGAITAALEHGIPFEQASQALRSFSGVDRRFTFKGNMSTHARVFDDYGHHPNEIKHMLAIARAQAPGKLIVVLQPHRYTRTAKLWDLFIEVLASGPFDQLIITDVYPGPNETPIAQVSGERMATQLATQYHIPVHYVPMTPSFDLLWARLIASTGHDDLVLLLGAGNITAFAAALVSPTI